MSTLEDREFTVRATALVDEAALEEEDREVVGDHRIILPAAALEWSASRQAAAVLDRFHESVAVGMLEDFDFSVINPQGEEIFEDFDE